MAKDLRGLISPNSITVIGASKSSEKVGAIVLKNIIDSGFTGKIFPVNPKETEIASLKCYAHVRDLPEVPDLAVLAIPSSVANEVLDELGQIGIKNAVIFSAGYKEMGSEGEVLQKQLADIAKKYQINVLGPNCLGFANNDLPVNVTFGQVVKEVGNLRIISQSGAIAAALFDWCQTTKLGYSQFITIGNKAVINENDLLDYWLSQPDKPINQTGLSKVSPIGLYLESISNGSEFIRIATKISQHTPIFALKPGKSKGAKSAMQSHTGAIAGEDSVLDAAFKQAGIIRCQAMGEFFDIARALAWENAPQGPNVAIVSNAGGPAVLSTDSIETAGLKLAEFSPDTKEKLAEFLPRMASFLNPVDVLGDALADRFAQATEIILQEKTVDAVIVLLTPQLMTQIDKTADMIGHLSAKYSKPVLCSFIGGNVASAGEKILNEYKIPSFPFPEMAINTLSAMWRWQEWRQNHQLTESAKSPSESLADLPNLSAIKELITSARQNQQPALDNIASDHLVSLANINTPPMAQVSSLDQALQFTGENGWPVVLKLSSPALLHKADVGGVIVNLNNQENLTRSWQQLNAKITQLDTKIQSKVVLQIQKQIVDGIEVIVGIKRDPHFGPVMLFGAGGKLAELLKDRNLHLLPVSDSQIKQLVGQSKISTLLKGYRGDSPYDLEKLYKVMRNLTLIIDQLPDVAEIEINPLIVTHDQVWAVDNKILLTVQPPSQPTYTSPKFQTAKMIKHQLLAPSFHHYLFESPSPLNFISGKFISLKVSDNKINAYSIAGSPDQHHFELLVDTSPQGIGSKYFEALQEGEIVTFLGPVGIFTLKPENGSEHLIFMATGSGIAPIKYMIEDALINKGIKKPISLYFGLRHQEDIFWQDLFEQLKQKYANFNYQICLSKPSPEWRGATGHITDKVKQDFPDASRLSAYICGNKMMVEEAINLLLTSHCPKENIYYEKYN